MYLFIIKELFLFSNIMEELFDLIRKGNLDDIINYYKINENNFDIVSNHKIIFRYACSHNLVHIAKWLYDLNPNVDIKVYDEYAFDYACKNGNLEIAKLIYQIKPYINFCAGNINSFKGACENGQLHIVKWLVEIKPFLGTSTANDFAFKYACINGHLDVLKFLFSLKPDIDISRTSNMNKYLFIDACRNGHLDIIKWLLEKRHNGIYEYELIKKYNLMKPKMCLYFNDNLLNRKELKIKRKYNKSVSIINNCIFNYYIRNKLNII